jgi:hypothetical protein
MKWIAPAKQASCASRKETPATNSLSGVSLRPQELKWNATAD